MPVPKGKQKKYGKIVGANINRGKSLEEAKDIADRAVKHDGKGKNNKKAKAKKGQ